MNEAFVQLLTFLKSLPASKKIGLVVVSFLLLSGFATLFLLANRVDYQVLFNNISSKDAGAIVENLRNKNIPYKIEGDGTRILVPAKDVHELRLSMVSQGLPKEGNVGFEIFDKSDFKTTRFVQELNYKRALQGELARTITRFNEVVSAKVFIVIPKETLFVEDAVPSTASIQLELKSKLAPQKLAGIIHLVASAVEGLDPEQVTVVDTKGRIIFRGGNGSQGTSGLLNNMQLEYKQRVEGDIRTNVQSMLEGIVGAGKAIVRVTAEIDFNKSTLNEEEYDPTATAVRSRRDTEESTQVQAVNSGGQQTIINKRTGVIPADNGGQNGRRKRDTVTNYEINRVTRAIIKPAGTILRLSVAAVIDGTYETEIQEDGAQRRKYIPRSTEEIAQFEAIVKSAMGYSEDREDQISVDSIPFSDNLPVEFEPVEEKFNILEILNDSKKLIVNLFLMILVFFLLIRPLLKSLKKMASEPVFERKQLAAVGEDVKEIGASVSMGRRERVIEMAKTNPERTEQLIKGWIGDKA
jgi:flagellar M-ring protein FliF